MLKQGDTGVQGPPKTRAVLRFPLDAPERRFSRRSPIVKDAETGRLRP